LKAYSELSLPKELHKALVDLNFTTPTPIQEKAIPIALTGRDLIGCAATGTGKTAAFLIPTLTALSESPEAMALILLPTRELALQVASVHESLTKYLKGISAVTLIGGVPMKNQIKVLQRKPRIVMATPGRLVDHLNRGTINLKRLQILVLDEADRMLDMGFQPQLHEILRYLPEKRQTLFFSATMPGDIIKLSTRYLKNPEQVKVELSAEKKAEQATALKIEEKTVAVDQKGKNDALLNELNQRKGSVLVFARTQSRVDRVTRFLESYKISAARIHGGRSQGQRVRALDGFRDGEFRVLVATDLASRGIDIDHVAHVINFDLPQAPEDYVHRIGRTGRAGRSGEAVSFVTREDAPMWKAIERLKSGVVSMGPPGSGSQQRGGGRPVGKSHGVVRSGGSTSARHGNHAAGGRSGSSRSGAPSSNSQSDARPSRDSRSPRGERGNQLREPRAYPQSTFNGRGRDDESTRGGRPSANPAGRSDSRDRPATGSTSGNGGAPKDRPSVFRSSNRRSLNK
jgi:ATP-dependent RNA helicase DeaD